MHSRHPHSVEAAVWAVRERERGLRTDHGEFVRWSLQNARSPTTLLSDHSSSFVAVTSTPSTPSTPQEKDCDDEEHMLHHSQLPIYEAYDSNYFRIPDQLLERIPLAMPHNLLGLSQGLESWPFSIFYWPPWPDHRIWDCRQIKVIKADKQTEAKRPMRWRVAIGSKILDNRITPCTLYSSTNTWYKHT